MVAAAEEKKQIRLLSLQRRRLKGNMSELWSEAENANREWFFTSSSNTRNRQK